MEINLKNESSEKSKVIMNRNLHQRRKKPQKTILSMNVEKEKKWEQLRKKGAKNCEMNFKILFPYSLAINGCLWLRRKRTSP